MTLTDIVTGNAFLSRYMEMTKRDECDELYRLWSGIATLSAALERRVWVDWEDGISYYPNQFICLVGDAAARKGTAMKPCYSLLSRVGVNFGPSSTPIETLIHRLAHTSDWITHVDSDGNLTELEPHASMFMHSPELTNLIGVKDSRAMQYFCELYDCLDSFRYCTHVHGDLNIENVCMTWLTGTTTENLEAHLPSESIGGGFTSRFIFAYGQESQILNSAVARKPAKQWRQALFDQLVTHLKGVKLLHGPFYVTAECEAAYIAWREYAKRNPPGPAYDPKLKGYMGRRPAHLRKLMMALSAGRGSDLTLRDTDYVTAVAILEHTERFMSQALRRVGATTQQMLITSIYDMIINQTARGFKVTFKDIMRKHIGMSDTETIKDLIKQAVAVDWITTVEHNGVQHFNKGRIDARTGEPWGEGQ